MSELPTLPALPILCPQYGHRNIPERTICKRCGSHLPEHTTTIVTSQLAPVRTIYRATLPVIPRPLVLLFLVIFSGPLLAGLVLMDAAVLAVLVGGLLLVGCARFISQPTVPKEMTLSITPDWLDYSDPRVHITTTWTNVAQLRGDDEIVLAHPAASRVTPPQFLRTSSLDRWACTIPLGGFESNEQVAIVQAVKHYAPHVISIPYIEEEEKDV